MNRLLLILYLAGYFFSCTVIERSSSHGFEDGYYKLKSADKNPRKVYLDVEEDKIDSYEITKGVLENHPSIQISSGESDSLHFYPFRFIRQSMDMDITSNLLKFHPAVYGKPSQLLTDFNAAVYIGLRWDFFSIVSRMTPLNKSKYSLHARGFDIGVFAGPGTTGIGPFSTLNKIDDEYSGFTIEYGIAGFLESSFASFGLSVGYDYLLTEDRKVWIYNRKPWIGFIIGIALN
jgi:hypothetical protein